MNLQRQQQYENFLLEILRVTEENNGNSLAVFSLLQENLEKLDTQLIQNLQNWLEKASYQPDVVPNHRTAIAIVNFSNFIGQFQLGNRAINVEIAIELYNIALLFFVRNSFPREWSNLQMNLGNAYRMRLRGERADNLEKAISYYNAALEECPRDRLPQNWGMIQMNLGTAYYWRIKGNKAENLEQDIRCCNLALEECSREVYPEQWAMLQHNLGNAYRDRIYGQTAENIEIAIHHYNLALEESPRERFPELWAMLKSNLGNAYSKRIRGKAVENLELAITVTQSALQIYTPNIFPADWARTQLTLGKAFLLRIEGDRSENLEAAIEAFKNALQVYTREESPGDWAAATGNLGTAYYLRVRGDVVQNHENAIAAYQATLQIYSVEAFPERWAMAQMNLGNAYSDRNLGNREENLKLAIEAYQLALNVYTHEGFPEMWAMNKNNLGIAYKNLQIDREENIERAINCYQEALQVRTFEAFPQQWAETLINLSGAYAERIQGERRINLETAIGYCNDALQICTRDAFPQQWALIQNSLGVSYRECQKISEAIQAFQLALEIFTPDSFPMDCIRIGRLLGDTAATVRQWDNAIDGYATAINVIEQLRIEMKVELRRHSIIEKFLAIYEKMVKICINAEKINKALETVERNKSRSLIELLTNSELYPKGASDSLKQELRKLKNTISSLRQLLAQADGNSTLNDDAFGILHTSETSNLTHKYITQQRQLLQEYQHQLDEVFAQCQELDPAFTLTQKVQPITLVEIRDLIDSQTAIIEWHISTDSFQTFIITQSSLEVMQFDKAELKKLEAWNQQYIEALFNKTENWRDNLSNWLRILSKILRFDEILNHPALANCDSLVLVPHRYLHLFPLHALTINQQTWLRFNEQTPNLKSPANPCLLDCFKRGIRYTPSCQLLQRVQQRQRPPADTRALFAIQNPTQDLHYTDMEIEVIKRTFTPVHILSKEQATKTALIANLETLAQAHYAHFSCHGFFNFQTPLISSLILAEAIESTALPTTTGTKSLRLRSGQQADPAKCLTLQDIFATLNLPQCRLVTLSACETGLIDTTSPIDECIGLATGFLYAGSLGVISSLWSVDDFATAFLMIKCYENLQTSEIAVALNSAQIWLRNVTQAELWDWINHLHLDKEVTKKIKKKLPFAPDEQPFFDPFYWASFCAIGQ